MLRKSGGHKMAILQYHDRQSSKLRRKVLWDGVAFIVPLLQFVELPMVGRLLGSEIFLLFLFPILLAKRRHCLFAPLPRTFLFLGALWFSGQILTDLTFSTPFIDYARGWSKIGFILISFSTLYLLFIDQPNRIVLFAAGLALGGILDFYFSPNIRAEHYFWKFGIGIPITLFFILFCLVLRARRHYWLVVGVMVVVAFLNLYFDFRSLAGITFMTACYLGLHARHRHPNDLKPTVSPHRLLLLGVMGGISVFAILEVYASAAQTGWLGESAQQKYELQAYGVYGLLVGGRSEILVSSQAILDSPFIGHGSWAKDCRYTDMLIDLKRRLGYFPGGEKDECLIPSHSHLLGAWVEAGLAGAVFWLWALLLPIRVLAGPYRTQEHLMPLVVFFAFFLLWDILFSPLGAELRIRTPYEICLMIFFLPPPPQHSKLEQKLGTHPS